MRPVPDAIRWEVEELFDRYCRSIDERRLEGLAQVFTADCQATYGESEVSGYEALLAHLRSGLAPFAETRHRVSEVEVEIQPDGSLQSRARVVAWHRFEKDRPSLTLHGHYRCLLAWTQEGWRIAELVGSEDRREWGQLPTVP